MMKEITLTLIDGTTITISGNCDGITKVVHNMESVNNYLFIKDYVNED